MDNLQVFTKDEFGTIRTVQLNNETYFVGKDVAEALGYKNTRDALVAHVAEEDKNTVAISDGNRGNPNQTVINESGIYALIFGSKLESAKRFKHWVTSEILPSIRKHGMYAVDDLINDPDLAIKAFTALREERNKNKLLMEDVKRMKPKEEFFDAVADSKDAIEIGKVAKVLNFPGIGRNKLFEILRRKGILMKDNIPYQKFIDNGCFRTIEQKYSLPDGETRISIKTLVYQKGVDYIRKVLETA